MFIHFKNFRTAVEGETIPNEQAQSVLELIEKNRK